MTVQVEVGKDGYRIAGEWEGIGPANAFLGHLAARAFSPATIRAYAFDGVNLARFLTGEGIGLAGVTPVDVFAWVDWQGARRDGAASGGKVVALRRRTAAASTVNRRVAAVRAFFEYLVMTGARAAAWSGHPSGGAWPARASGAWASAGWGQAGAPAPAAAGVAACRGGGCVRGVVAHSPGPGHGAGDAAGRAALSGGPRPVARRR